MNLHDARLEYELHSDVLQRACGRGGAPVDLDRARAELDHTEDALRQLRAVLTPEARDA